MHAFDVEFAFTIRRLLLKDQIWDATVPILWTCESRSKLSI
jgi:hypothetical protein